MVVLYQSESSILPLISQFILHFTRIKRDEADNLQMSAQSQQIKQNFLSHPYTQQANSFVSGQVSSLDAEVSQRTASNIPYIGWFNVPRPGHL